MQGMLDNSPDGSDAEESIHRINEYMNRIMKQKAKIRIAKSKITAFMSSIINVQSELINEKREYWKLHALTEELAKKRKKLTEKTKSLIDAYECYDAFITVLPSIQTEFNVVSDKNISSTRELQLVIQEFLKQNNNSPWSIEKRQHLHSLQEDENRLAVTRRQIAVMNQKIEERRYQLKEHGKYSIQKFCLTLATFSRNRDAILKLLKQEETLNKELKEKLSKNRGIDESVFCKPIYICFFGQEAYYLNEADAESI